MMMEATALKEAERLIELGFVILGMGFAFILLIVIFKSIFSAPHSGKGIKEAVKVNGHIALKLDEELKASASLNFYTPTVDELIALKQGRRSEEVAEGWLKQLEGQQQSLEGLVEAEEHQSKEYVIKAQRMRQEIEANINYLHHIRQQPA